MATPLPLAPIPKPLASRARDEHAINRQLEQEVTAMAQSLVADMLDMRQQIGSLPPFAPESKRDPAIEAALYLPYWWVYGNAEPEISGPFWDDILKGIDPVNGKVDPDGGPVKADAFHQRMLQLWDTRDPPYALLAAKLMPDDVKADYKAMRQVGWHLGQPKDHLRRWLPSQKLPEPQDPAERSPEEQLFRSMLQLGRAKMADLPPTSGTTPANGLDTRLLGG